MHDRPRDARTPTVHSTLWGAFPPGVVVHDHRELGPVGTLRSLLRVRRGDAVVVCGSIGLSHLWRDLAYAHVLRRARPDLGLVVVDATWSPRSSPGESRHRSLHGLLRWWNKALLRWLDGPRTHVCLLSTAEVDEYVRDTGTDPARVHFTPFPATFEDADVVVDLTDPGDGYVLAVGDALRDWDVLREAVTGTDIPVQVAALRDSGTWPSNVTVSALGRDAFVDRLAHASVVCLPLDTAPTRSAGQQSFLNAMFFGRPVVVTDATGVRDYLTPSVDAYVVPNTAEAVREALRTAIAGGEDVRTVARRGAETARRYTYVRYWRQVTDIALTAAGGSARTAADAVATS